MTARKARVPAWHALAQRTGSIACDRSRECAKLAASRSSVRSIDRARDRRHRAQVSPWLPECAARRRPSARPLDQVTSLDRRRSPATGRNNARSSPAGLARGFSRERSLARRDPHRSRAQHARFRALAMFLATRTRESSPGSRATTARHPIPAPERPRHAPRSLRPQRARRIPAMLPRAETAERR